MQGINSEQKIVLFQLTNLSTLGYLQKIRNNKLTRAFDLCSDQANFRTRYSRIYHNLTLKRINLFDRNPERN